jgi:hypothetical protein
MNNQAILQIGFLKFIIEQGFSDGYTNTIDPSPSQFYRTHPAVFIWKGGQFKPIQISINLIVDREGQDGCSTPEGLVEILAEIMSYSLRTEKSVTGPKSVTLRVGTWFERTGYITDVNVEFKPPWDITTGMPMAAEAKFILLPDFLAGESVEKAINSTNMPTNESFNRDGFKCKGSL